MMQSPWIASYDRDVPSGVPGGEGMLPDLLQAAACQWPTRPALIFCGRRIRYRQLWCQVDQCARVLASQGIAAGARVALLLPNTPHFVVAYYAIVQLGAIAVPLNPISTPQELQQQLRDADAALLVTLDLLLERVPADCQAQIIAGRVQDYLPFVKKCIYPIRRQKETANRAGVRWFHRLMRLRLPPAPSAAPEPSLPAALQYTGGTTGGTKAAILTHANLVHNNRQMRSWFPGLRAGRECFAAVLPFFHAYGMATAMHLPLSVGATVVLFPRFVAGEVLRAIQRYRATVLPGIPSLYAALNCCRDVGNYDISSVALCISGAAPLPRSVYDEFEHKTGAIIVEGYGLSEASPVTHCNPVAGRRKIGSIGLPLPGTACKIVDPETGAEVAPGAEGELCIRGPQVMAGYWRNARETSAVLRSGWLLTGDIARMDAQGYFYITERKKDMIIAEGFNVYPREIEECLLAHPAVSDAAVVGVRDRLRGERVHAFVVLQPDAAAAPAELRAHCRQRLAAYKVPRHIEMTDEIPTTVTGKKLRRILRERAGHTHGGDDES